MEPRAIATDRRPAGTTARERQRAEPILRVLPLATIMAAISIAAITIATTLVAHAARPRVILVGDSVTAGYGASDAGHSWTALLGVPAQVDAMPGAPSGAFVGRTWAAQTVVVTLGLNDYGQRVAPADFGARMRTIVASITAEHLVLVVPYQVGSEGRAPWDAYADQLLAIGREDHRMVLVDLRPAFGNPSTDLLDAELVHPNDVGHALMARLVAQAITP